MPKKTKVLSDRYKSTTKIYPKVIMESLTPEVKEYIEGAGDTKYVTKQEENEPYVSTIGHSGDEIILQVEDTENGGGCYVSIEQGEFNVTLGDDTNNYTLGLTNTGDFTVQSTEGETIHNLTFDSEGNLKVDGQAVGGKQLYQHNIVFQQNNTKYNSCRFTIINEQSTAMNIDDIKLWLNSKGFISGDYNYYNACGGWTFSPDYYAVVGIAYNPTTNNLVWEGQVSTNSNNITATLPYNSGVSLKDTVIAL